MRSTHNVTRRRVHVLKEANEVSPVPGPWRPDWPMRFLVGDVLDAHLRIPIRAAPQGELTNQL